MDKAVEEASPDAAWCDSKLTSVVKVGLDPRIVERQGMGFFAPFLIETGPLRGRSARDHRRTLDAIFWIARTGASWRDLAQELGHWNSVHRQYRRWTTSGLWDLMLEALADGGGNDAVQMVDSTSIRAHHRAAGARGD